MVSGTIEAVPTVDEEPVEDVAADVVLPKVEELDDVVENDTLQELDMAPVTEAENDVKEGKWPHKDKLDYSPKIDG